jgi:beta-mannosidase
LEDPFIGFNELSARWVNEKSWTYRNVFQKPEVPAGSSVFLVFDGLDTFATVKLDDQTILESDNMFLAHRLRVSTQLRLISTVPYFELVNFESSIQSTSGSASTVILQE